MVEISRTSTQHGLEAVNGLELIFGEARFTGPRTIAVKKNDGNTLSLTAGKIFIDTGTRAAMPKIDGFDKIADFSNVLNNVSVMEVEHVPGHLLVLGGGYIGLEFAQMFRRFGSRVTIVQSGPQLLMREDADVAEEVTRILREDGIEVLLDAKVRQVSGDSNEVALELKGGPLKGTHLLIAVGRTPNTDDLNLAAAGIATDGHGYVRVNRWLETNVEGVYGIGDVKGGPAFTHISYDDYRVLRANLLESGNESIEGRMVPYAVFIDPQLGRIGMTEQEARAQGRSIRVAKMPMTFVARAREFGETRGLMKVVVDAETKQIVGAAVLGMEGGELAGMFQLAMMGGLPYTALQEGIFSHPTLAESLNVIFNHFVD
jgi:pyruvate/2-oxoglutarate dehydrogenase complex dihydrolipoamide dehydrogenase (E3) component